MICRYHKHLAYCVLCAEGKDHETLEAWCAKAKVPAIGIAPSLRVIQQSIPTACYADLWNLRDYRVSFVAAGSIWLAPIGGAS